MRKNWKKIAAGILAGAMALSMAACGGSSDSGAAAGSSAAASSAAADSASSAAASSAAAESKDGNLVLGVCVQTLKANVYTVMRDSAVAEGEKEGVDVLYQSCELNAATQKNQVETMLSQGIDVLLLEPADMESMASTAQMARDAGIPVITMEMGIQGFQSDLWLTSNSYDVGKQQVEALLNEIGEDTKANIVLFPGTVGDFVAEEISQGVRDAVAEHDNLTIVVDQAVPEWDRQKAMNLMEDAIVQTGGDIQAVLANNDNMALGARKAAENAGIADDIWFIGADNDEEMDQAIIDGKKMRTIDKGAVEQGRRMIEVTKKLAAGEDVPVDEEVDGVPVWYTPTAIVTPDTVEEISGPKFPDLFK